MEPSEKNRTGERSSELMETISSAIYRNHVSVFCRNHDVPISLCAC